MNIKAPLNVYNFKTKPSFDKWSIPYDRGLYTADESSAACRAFQKSPDGN